MGRRTKLTPEMREKIAKLIRDGNYVEVACRAVGISQASYFAWKKRGESGGRGNAIYVEFLEAIKKAESEAEALYLSKIQEAAKAGTWQAAAWYLERRYPKRWGRRMDVTTGNKPIEKISVIEVVRNDTE